MDNENAIIMELNNILENIEKLEKDVYDYIVNTEHYIFYWIHNKEVQEFINEYPDEYEDMIHIHVTNVSDIPTIKICFERHPDDIEYINRYAILSTFRHETNARWLEWGGNVKDRQIAEKEEELEYHKERIEAIVKELEHLKK
jgi:hypothetical protein